MSNKIRLIGTPSNQAMMGICFSFIKVKSTVLQKPLLNASTAKL